MTMILRASSRIVLKILAFAALDWSQQIDAISLTSLELKVLHDGVEIGTATGFVMAKGTKYYLVTNRHVVLHCALDGNPANTGGWICANKLAIFHNRVNRLGTWFWVEERLYDDHERKRWLEHPTLAGAADLVALPLEHLENVQFYPLDIELRNTDIVVKPGDSVSIVGFPLGLAQAVGLPIWKTGTVASDSEVTWSGRPMFLVDTTSRQGMSGSPVYAVRTAAYRNSAGSLLMTEGGAKKFLGVFSEQNLQAELGGVWKAQAVQDLYASLP
jgi:Trypsin-like peptidase domain